MAIHETVPEHAYAHAKVPQHEVTRRVKIALRQMIGEENVRTSGEIADMIGIPRKGNNEPIRKAAKELLCEEGIAVVSSVRGFYVADTPEEVDACVENLQARIAGIERDIEALRGAKLGKKAMKMPVKKLQTKKVT